MIVCVYNPANASDGVANVGRVRVWVHFGIARGGDGTLTRSVTVYELDMAGPGLDINFCEWLASQGHGTGLVSEFDPWLMPTSGLIAPINSVAYNTNFGGPLSGTTYRGRGASQIPVFLNTIPAPQDYAVSEFDANYLFHNEGIAFAVVDVGNGSAPALG